MKTIQIDDDLYQFIAGRTERIGESASDILRRLLMGPVSMTPPAISDDEEQTVATLCSPAELEQISGAASRFIAILAQLYQQNPDGFAKVLQLKGRKRLYFATSEAALQDSGSSTRPRPIPGSPFWAITNFNSAKKKRVLTMVMNELDVAPAQQLQLLSYF